MHLKFDNLIYSIMLGFYTVFHNKHNCNYLFGLPIQIIDHYDSEPRDISNFVSGFESTFMLIFWVAVFLLWGITLTMIYFIYRYNRKKNPVATQIKGSVPLRSCGPHTGSPGPCNVPVRMDRMETHA
jgi:hypothetical protein